MGGFGSVQSALDGFLSYSGMFGGTVHIVSDMDESLRTWASLVSHSRLQWGV